MEKYNFDLHVSTRIFLGSSAPISIGMIHLNPQKSNKKKRSAIFYNHPFNDEYCAILSLDRKVQARKDKCTGLKLAMCMFLEL